MQVRLLHTTGNGIFQETSWDVPEPKDTEIQVKNIMTGVCRSDIDMALGDFTALPLSMQGHEGLGRVIKVGNDVKDVYVGEIVATRGEPAYADVYNVACESYVVVPEAHSKYIIEPVACGINIIHQPLMEITKRSGMYSRLLILGSGFLAWVAYNVLKIQKIKFDIDVVGSNNKEVWGDILKSDYSGTYDVIIDLSGRTNIFDEPIYNNETLFIFGAQKTITTDFSNLLWKACTIVFPSPRTEGFYKCMRDAVYWINKGELVVDHFWSKEYNRDTEWQQAFLDGINREPGYSRGYIKWAD